MLVLLFPQLPGPLLRASCTQSPLDLPHDAQLAADALLRQLRSSLLCSMQQHCTINHCNCYISDCGSLEAICCQPTHARSRLNTDLQKSVGTGSELDRRSATDYRVLDRSGPVSLGPCVLYSAVKLFSK